MVEVKRVEFLSVLKMVSADIAAIVCLSPKVSVADADKYKLPLIRKCPIKISEPGEIRIYFDRRSQRINPAIFYEMYSCDSS